MHKKFTHNDNLTSKITTFRKEYLEQYATKKNNGEEQGRKAGNVHPINYKLPQ